MLPVRHNFLNIYRYGNGGYSEKSIRHQFSRKINFPGWFQTAMGSLKKKECIAAFDPFYIYVSIGDGGGADDKDMGHVSDWYNKNAGGNGQDKKQNLLGSILRIDVNNGNPYGIPSDNPFADGKNGLKEIYAYGLRNPYRFCFAPDGSLIAADAGQELYEEIDVITKGGNYGWNVKEGRHCFNAADNKHPFDSCPDKR